MDSLIHSNCREPMSDVEINVWTIEPGRVLNSDADFIVVDCHHKAAEVAKMIAERLIDEQKVGDAVTIKITMGRMTRQDYAAAVAEI